MEVISTYKHARISPKKARDVAREIQGLPVSQALDIVTFTPKKAAFLIGKTLKTAIADAENNFNLDVETLTVKEAVVNIGPVFKRFKPRARGSAGAIRKSTSHIRVTLTDSAAPVAEKAAPKKAAPKKVEAKPVEAKETEAPASTADASKRGFIYSEKPEQSDNLKRISGVGPVEKLNGLGIYTFKQVADWSEENITEFDDLLSFKGRIERDNWLQQAADLHNEKYGDA